MSASLTLGMKASKQVWLILESFKYLLARPLFVLIDHTLLLVMLQSHINGINTILQFLNLIV